MIPAGALLLTAAQAYADHRSVGVNSANFRTGPSTKRPIMFTADRYYPVEVLRCEDGWCETRDFEGDRAWVAERLLIDQPAIVVNVDRANIRKRPTTRSKVVFRVDWGEALKVTDRRDGWVAIEDIEGETGWLYAKLTWGLPPSQGKPSEDQDKSKGKGAK